MFKIKDKILPLTSTPHAKLKQKVWGVSGAIFLLSILLIEVINVRSGSHQNEMLLLIKNIYLIIPWGIAYFIASRHRDLLKIFTPLYLSLILLVLAISLAFKSQNMQEKFEKEMANIGKDFVDFLDGKQSTSLSRSLAYSVDEYGHFATYLNKFKNSIELSLQEGEAVEKAINEVELDKIFSDEVLLNFFNIIDKKKKLERLLIFLEESAKRTEDIYSEFATWVLFSSDVDEVSRKNFAKAYYRTPEEKKFLRQEPYRIRKSIAQAYIKLLNFLSEIYGTYSKEANGQIIFANDNDLQAFSSHDETLSKLFQEAENFSLLFQERVRNTMMH